ncbi:MAG: NADH-quinone oxidoreductase subunit H [Phycisphaeraceae bacterium]|nr:NADH-quinone oxidoreductase subunit H [Phycisphaeraceae bacterium]
MLTDISPQWIASSVVALLVLPVMLLTVAYLILLERKIASWTQDRIGPNRVGFSFGILPLNFHFWGLGQPLADGLKFLMKEDYTPTGTDRMLFILAPALAAIPAVIGWAVMPWGGYLRWGEDMVQVAALPINIGVIYVLAIGSLAVYGVVLGGFASNNKYSFLGGLRATAQMVSYEIPLGLSVLIVLLMTGQTDAQVIVVGQANAVWNIVYMPLLAVIFFTCSLAECNRAPFDLAEAEQELVGGYHTEYSSMKFALFFLSEYLHMITACAFFTLLFLGGWDLPLVHEPAVGGLGWVVWKCLAYGAKVLVLLALMMMIRWTLPRLRFDQLMRLAWRSLIPVTLAMLLMTGLVVAMNWPKWALLAGNVAIFAALLVIGPMIPQGSVENRRVGLAGSRFSPQ